MESDEIKSDKILVKEIFSSMWFRVPEYQRPYVWGADEINDLLDDISYAMLEKPDSEYFLGSFVYQSKSANPAAGNQFDENDLLDGQQRMTTLLLLFSVIRDIAANPKAKERCQQCILQEADEYTNTPERSRITFCIRQDAQDFIDVVVKEVGTTQNDELLDEYKKSGNDISIQSMAKAIGHIKKFFSDNKKVEPDRLLKFLLNNVLLIYVSTENLDDAFRLFTILNDRGVPLRNSDILKSINLGALTTQEDKKKYAKLWEDAESELGEDFDRFLNYIRTLLVKEKARLNLLQEFEDKIYEPKEKEKSTGKKKPPLLAKGKQTFQMVEKYLKLYKQLFDSSNYDLTGDFKFDNLLKVMSTGLPSSDWIPPLLRYYDKFGKTRLYDFLLALDNKFSADWVTQETPTARIEAMNTVIKKIDEDGATADDVFSSGCLNINDADLKRMLEGKIYGRRFARYILLKLDYLFQNHDQKMHFETLSVEHILPQNPETESQWAADFSEDERSKVTDTLGNLVLITRRKNTSQGRLDYSDKKKRYFEKNIDTCPNSLRILQNYDQWTPVQLSANHNETINRLMKHYGVVASKVAA